MSRDPADVAALMNMDGRMLLIAQVVEGARLHYLTEAEALEQIHGIVDGAGDYFKHLLRESGGSLPAECPCGEGKNPLHAFLNCGQAPVLNKSGGSDVCVCGHEAGRHGNNTCGGPQGNCECDHYEPAAGPAPRLGRRR